MGIYEELVSQYDIGKKSLDCGDEINKLELMFIGYALDAADTAKRNFKINLDFTEDSIKQVELILGKLNKTISSENPSNDLIIKFAKQYSGYIGQVMKLKWGGEWKDENEYSIKNGPVLKVKNQELFLLSKVYRRITSGENDNIWDFYQVVRNEIEGTFKINEEKIEEMKVKEKKNNLFKKIFGK